MNKINKDEFIRVLDENIGILIKISRIYAFNEEDRKDLINEITFQLWKSYSSFNGDSKISTWLYRVSLNVSMNYSRQKKKEFRFTSINDFDIDNKWIADYEVHNTEQYDILYKSIEKLSTINKAIILLYLDKQSHEEIAVVMGTSASNVGTRIGRIKQELKNLIIKA